VVPYPSVEKHRTRARVYTTIKTKENEKYCVFYRYKNVLITCKMVQLVGTFIAKNDIAWHTI